MTVWTLFLLGRCYLPKDPLYLLLYREGEQLDQNHQIYYDLQESAHIMDSGDTD